MATLRLVATATETNCHTLESGLPVTIFFVAESFEEEPMDRVRRLASLTSILAMLAAGSSPAATFVVTKTADTFDGSCDVSDCSLREAIQAAHFAPGEDVVEVPAGRYILSLGGPGEDGNAEGDLDIFYGSEITIQGDGIGATIIDGDDNDRIFHLVSADLRLRDLTLEAGAAGVGSGGGIFASGDMLLDLTRVRVAGNAASSGGGIYVGNTDVLLLVQDSEIRGNTGNTGVGLYALNATVSITNSLIRDNIASGDGGGIFNSDGGVSPFFEIIDTTISGNTAMGGNGGGGIWNASGTIAMHRCTVSGNTAATGPGGGIRATGNMAITNSTISGNETLASSGAGIFATSSSFVEFRNSTITANHAATVGGGIAVSGTNAVLGNTIVAANTDGGNPAASDCFAFPEGQLLLSGDNLLGAGEAACSISSSQGGSVTDLMGTPENPLDARLGPLADNGGETLTHRLLAGSPAIDAGNDVTCEPTDQRGIMRPLDGDGIGGPACDIGAVEVVPEAGPFLAATAALLALGALRRTHA